MTPIYEIQTKTWRKLECENKAAATALESTVSLFIVPTSEFIINNLDII